VSREEHSDRVGNESGCGPGASAILTLPSGSVPSAMLSSTPNTNLPRQLPVKPSYPSNRQGLFFDPNCVRDWARIHPDALAHPHPVGSIQHRETITELKQLLESLHISENAASPDSEADKRSSIARFIKLSWTVSPIRRLPNEIITEVFLLIKHAWVETPSTTHMCSSLEVTYCLGGVSRHWRVLVNGTSRLWDHIRIPCQVPFPTMLKNTMRLHVSNSSALPFHIEFKPSAISLPWGDNQCAKVFAPLLRASNRWKEARIPIEAAHAIRLCLTRSAKLASDGPNIENEVYWDLPSLETLSLLEAPRATLVSFPMLNALSLRTLALVRVGSLDVPAYARFVSDAPNVTKLIFQDVY
jgi:hypothetical protein